MKEEFVTKKKANEKEATGENEVKKKKALRKIKSTLLLKNAFTSWYFHFSLLGNRSIWRKKQNFSTITIQYLQFIAYGSETVYKNGIQIICWNISNPTVIRTLR